DFCKFAPFPGFDHSVEPLARRGHGARASFARSWRSGTMGWFDLLWKGMWRRPGRTTLTAASLASAFLLLGLLAPILSLFGHRGDLTGVERLIVQPRHSITDFLPVSHEGAIRALPGVRATTHITWFGGTFRDGADSF